eukprot:TRINITY_DN23684_c0_g1_i2.p2 TRINITY_DN23684_c0_g1~~TRINITY_DN23684_c0_g1_i2.p2  ORF type:complete len:149 (-),score=25.54 TRINITY_DN23684_c0_g1_i2:169-615(-)
MAWRGLSSRLGLSLALVSFARCSGAVRVGDDTRPAATGRSRLSSSDRQLSGTDAVQKEEEELERMDREQFDDMIHMMAAMNVLKQPSDEDASAASEIGGMSKESHVSSDVGRRAAGRDGHTSTGVQGCVLARSRAHRRRERPPPHSGS